MVDLLQNQELSGFFSSFLGKRNLISAVLRRVFRKLHLFQQHRPVHERRSDSRLKMKHYKNTITACRNEGAEFIISYLHIGGQYNDRPTQYTKKVCTLSGKYGVDAVISNHEHVIHPIDMKKFSNGQFCVYSLGNFLSSTGTKKEPYDKLAEYSVVVHVELERKNNQIKVNYLITLCHSWIQEESSTVAISTLYETIQGESDDIKRDKLVSVYQLLMNRLLETDGKRYDIVEEYKIT